MTDNEYVLEAAKMLGLTLLIDTYRPDPQIKEYGLSVDNPLTHRLLFLAILEKKQLNIMRFPHGIICHPLAAVAKTDKDLPLATIRKFVDMKKEAK